MSFRTRLYVKPVLRAKQQGYHVELIYVALPTASLAKQRVKNRVSEGGHDIPADVIERRFYRSLNNLSHRYAKVADEWRIFDNASSSIPQLILSGNGSTIKIHQEKKWQKLRKLAENNQPSVARRMRASASRWEKRSAKCAAMPR